VTFYVFTIDTKKSSLRKGKRASGRIETGPLGSAVCKRPSLNRI